MTAKKPGATVVRITLSPLMAALAPGATLAMTATGYDAKGAVVPSLGASWAWVTSNKGIVSLSGMTAKAVAPGRAIVTVSINGVSATAELIVVTETGTPDVPGESLVPISALGAMVGTLLPEPYQVDT